MKKFIGGFAVGALLFCTIGAYAVTYTAKKADFPVFVNGVEFHGTTGEILEVDGRTYLPLLDMGNALNVPVYWNEELRQVEVGTTPINNSGNTEQNAATLSELNAKYAGILRPILAELGDHLLNGWEPSPAYWSNDDEITLSLAGGIYKSDKSYLNSSNYLEHHPTAILHIPLYSAIDEIYTQYLAEKASI